MPDNQVFTDPSNSHCSMSQPVQNLSKFYFRIKSFSALSVDRRCTPEESEPRLEFSKSIPQWTGRPSNKTPARATCWSRHLSRDCWQISICVFLRSIKCQHRVWQQRLLHQRYKTRT